MAKEFKLTPERLKELQDELTYLKTVREKEVAELIRGERGRRRLLHPPGLHRHRAGQGVQ